MRQDESYPVAEIVDTLWAAGATPQPLL